MFRNGLEPWHLLILLAIVLLMFGSTKLPELARGVGRSIRIFKTEMAEIGESGARSGPDGSPISSAADQETELR